MVFGVGGVSVVALLRMASDAFVDPKLLGRPPAFSGDECDWEDWAFTVRAYLSTLGDDSSSIESWMEDSERVPTAISNDRLTSEARAFSAKLYFILAMLLKSTALVILKRVPRAHGLEAWRQLVQRYEKQAPGHEELS